jgi:hypothetical protein
MTTKIYDPATASRLITEAREDDVTTRATSILHEACRRDIRERRPGDLQMVSHVIRDVLVARRALADQLEAATAEVVRLRSELANANGKIDGMTEGAEYLAEETV